MITQSVYDDKAYYDAGEDYLERREQQLMDLAHSLKEAKPGERVPWLTVSASLLKRTWFAFGKYGRVNANDIDKIADRVLTNIARLRACSEMMGHTPDYGTRDELDESGYTFTDAEWEDKMAEYFVDACGNWTISDYGLPKLEALYYDIFNADSPEAKLYAVDKALNVIHQRSDLSALFIEGGIKTLVQVSLQS